MLMHKGRRVDKGPISEHVYEDFIDRAYGLGYDLRETKIWAPNMERGFVFPNDEGYHVFAYVNGRPYYAGAYSYEELFDEEESWTEKTDRLYSEADRAPSSEAIDILRSIYLDDNSKDEWTPEGLRMAQDEEALRWMADYWSYVRWNEHGNECCLSEVGFQGMVDSIMDPSYVIEYLEDEEELIRRLRALNRKYGRQRT